MRPSVALIYGAIAVISISAAAMLYRLTPLPLSFAIMFGAISFFALAILDQILSRAADRTAFQRQLEASDHALQDAFNEIDMMRSRLVSLETDMQQQVDAGVAPLAQDLQAVGALLAQVTEAVADTDHRVITLEEEMRRTPRAQPQADPEKRPALNGPAPTDETQAAPAPAPAHSASPSEPRTVAGAGEAERSRALLRRVASAVDKDQIETTLQSIVTLPQRRARAYALAFNLKLDGAGTLEARHAVPAIEAAGRSEQFDKAALRRALALTERFAARESASMVFVPLSGAALMRSKFADWLVAVLGERKDQAGRLVLEVSQKDLRAFTPLDFELMSTLADYGFRMCVSHVTDARGELFDLARYGVRYAKASAALFLGSDAASLSDIHPEDLSDLAARNGMDLIVDQVESEAQIVELLDYRLKYGQGNLFARPRMVDVEPVDEAQATMDRDGPAPNPLRTDRRPGRQGFDLTEPVQPEPARADRSERPPRRRTGTPMSRTA